MHQFDFPQGAKINDRRNDVLGRFGFDGISEHPTGRNVDNNKGLLFAIDAF